MHTPFPKKNMFVYRTCGAVKMPSPIANSFCLAVMLNKNIVGFVPLLLIARHPSAVFGAVIAIHINAVNGQIVAVSV